MIWIIAGIIVFLLAYVYLVRATSDGDVSSAYELSDEVGDGKGE